MPEVPPVTSATFPFSVPLFILFLSFRFLLSAESESGLMMVERGEVMGHEQFVVSRVGRLKIEFLDVRLDQIGKKQVREPRQFPGFRFFLIEDEVNDFAQVGISLFVVEL